jgi:hypothetical protein
MATHSVTHSASPDGWSLCGTLRLLALLLLGSTAVAQTSAWELKRDLEGIKVFTRSVDGSPFKEVRSESTITGVTLNSLVALIEDAQACPNWADKCAQSYLVERTSATQSLVYTHNDMPRLRQRRGGQSYLAARPTVPQCKDDQHGSFRWRRAPARQIAAH